MREAGCWESRSLPPTLSIFYGSVPLLPQDLHHGFITGGSSDASCSRAALNSLSVRLGLEQARLPDIQTPIITTETFLTGSANLSLVFCFWMYGEVIAEINHATVLANAMGMGRKTEVLPFLEKLKTPMQKPVKRGFNQADL